MQNHINIMSDYHKDCRELLHIVRYYVILCLLLTQVIAQENSLSNEIHTLIVPSFITTVEGDGLIASPEPDWPQWRGPHRDGISDEKGLLSSWPQSGAKLLWKIDNLGK